MRGNIRAYVVTSHMGHGYGFEVEGLYATARDAADDLRELLRDKPNRFMTVTTPEGRSMDGFYACQPDDEDEGEAGKRLEEAFAALADLGVR